MLTLVAVKALSIIPLKPYTVSQSPLGAGTGALPGRLICPPPQKGLNWKWLQTIEKEGKALCECTGLVVFNSRKEGGQKDCLCGPLLFFDTGDSCGRRHYSMFWQLSIWLDHLSVPLLSGYNIPEITRNFTLSQWGPKWGAHYYGPYHFV